MAHPGSCRHWKWRPLGVATPGSGGPWEWWILGLADPGSGGPKPNRRDGACVPSCLTMSESVVRNTTQRAITVINTNGDGLAYLCIGSS